MAVRFAEMTCLFLLSAALAGGTDGRAKREVIVHSRTESASGSRTPCAF
jgi:hypothetical protein